MASAGGPLPIALRSISCVVLVAPLFACNDPAGVVEVSTATASGLTAVGVPGWELADTPTVVFHLSDGSPAAGTRVTWSVREGGGSVRVLDSITDAAGQARAIWALGSRPGMNRLAVSSVTGVSEEFVAMGDIFRADYVTSNEELACGLSAGDLWCWEPGGTDHLGLGGSVVSIGPDGQPAEAPVRVAAGRPLTEVAVARTQVCGLDSTGAAWCSQELGQPFDQVAGLPPIRGLVSDQSTSGFGVNRFCGLAIADSTAWCWRRAEPAPLRLSGSPAFRKIWYSKSDGFGAFAVAYPDARGCGLLADSTAVCWGRGAPGDGSGAGGGLDSLVAVTGGQRFVELAVGDRFSCGRTPIGEVWCWGGSGDAPEAFVPLLLRSDVRLIGSSVQEVLLYTTTRQFLMREGTYLPLWNSPEPSGYYQPPEGLEGLPVVRFGENSSDCVLLAGSEVYCSKASSFPPRHYLPVPPLRP